MNRKQISFLSILLILVLSSSCNSQPATPIIIELATKTAIAMLPTATAGSSPSAPASTEVEPITEHLMKPADVATVPAKVGYDVQSSPGAAPYGDSYNLNLFERPYLLGMTYVPDLDIVTFGLSEDANWYYISIELSGANPNNSIGIHYGVEIDQNADGFGDFLIWAQPPYTTAWETRTVQVFSDSDHDSAGLSSTRSDAGFEGNGYDSLIFDGPSGQADDPDLAWVRIVEGRGAIVQFAFKKSLAGSVFTFGTVADAGLKDVSRFDYNDHFTDREAGSPVQSERNFPVGLVYAVDNTCWEAFGLLNLEFVPKLCPIPSGPTATNRPKQNSLPTGVPTRPVDQTPVAPTGAPPTSVPPPSIPATEPPPSSGLPTLPPITIEVPLPG